MLSVEVQELDPDSTLSLYRRLLAARRELMVKAGPLRWLESAAEVLAFSRGGTQCWVNFGAAAVPLPAGRVVVGSAGCRTGLLPPDTAVWLQPDGGGTSDPGPKPLTLQERRP